MRDFHLSSDADALMIRRYDLLHHLNIVLRVASLLDIVNESEYFMATVAILTQVNVWTIQHHDSLIMKRTLNESQESERLSEANDS